VSSVAVEPVRGRRDLRAFIDLPYRLHRDDPEWVAPLRMRERQRFDARKNPLLDGKPYALFVARRGGELLGRVGAFPRGTGRGQGGFGFFESVDEQDVASALVASARAWLAEHGCAVAVGPMAFSTNEECGVLVEGFAEPPTLMNVHNPPYYDRLLCAAGLEKAHDMYQYSKEGLDFPERYQRSSEKLLERLGIRVRTSTKARLAEDARLIGHLFNDIWSENWGFEPLSEREIQLRAKELRLILDPELVAVAEKDGKPVGLGVVLPDLNVVHRRHRSGALLPNLVDMLLCMRRLDRVRVPLLGVVHELRGRGAEAAILSRLWRRVIQRRFKWAEAGWVLEDNVPMQNLLERIGFRRYKTVRMYELGA
jgi:GNAT superfamily N-acetyltransferase